MVRYSVVFTTYAWDSFVRRQVERVRSRVASGDFYILADETKGKLAIDAGFQTLSITENVATELGLSRQYNKALFWHNLDYLYIAFLSAHPDYDYYLFMDYDAVIGQDVDGLIADIARAGIDLVAEPVPESMASWKYTRQHAALYPADQIAGRILPIIILSRAALAHLSNRRRALSREATEGRVVFWPFCEAFVATELATAGYRAADLSQFGDTTNFAWWPPMLEDRLISVKEGAFVHPVLNFDRYVNSLLQHTPSRDLWTVPSRVRREAGHHARGMPAMFLRELKRRLGAALNKRFAFRARRAHEIAWDES